MATVPALFNLRGIIRKKEAREQWYSGELTMAKTLPPKRKYAFGSLNHKVVKVDNGWLLGSDVLPEDTPVYDYGFRIGERMSSPHGCWYFKHQIPGVNFRTRSSIEEMIFSVKDKTLERSRKKMLRVRCGNGLYRIVLTHEACHPICYIYGTNIRLDTRKYKVPEWMHRRTEVFPHPARTSRDEIKNKFGFKMRIGRPIVPGMVTVGGLEMLCTEVGPLCKIAFERKTYYAHPSVVFPL